MSVCIAWGMSMSHPDRAVAAAAPKRYRVPADTIQHETGFCYTAGMDFGEDGDKETRSQSQLLLFEDGKPLGPPRSLHADIRTKGKGRYSHWTHNHLYFSASDNSNPRSNGRVYEVASSNPQNTLGGLGQRSGPPKTHVEVVRSSQHEYSIELGGNLDFENSHTRHNSNVVVAFQPNVAVTIENTGETTVDWPKVIANDRADWGTFDSLLAEFTRGATTDQEKALFIWQTARENRYHETPLFADNEFHDAVKMFNSYGLNLCDDMGYCGCSLFKHAGLGKPAYSTDPKVRHLHGHVQCEAVVNGRHQFLDIDESVFHLDRENRYPVSGDECARDHDLVRREVHYGPVFGGWGGAESNAALFGADDAASTSFLRGHTMRYALRPREKAVFRWDNIGKWAAQSEKWDHRPKFFGNSKFTYQPRLQFEHFREGVAEAVDIVRAATPGCALAGGSVNARLAYSFDIPWAICGGTIRAEFVGGAAEDRFALDVRLDEKTSTRVWEKSGAGTHAAEVSIDAALKPRVSPAKYHYSVVVSLASHDERQGAALKSLSFETDVMAAPLSLPRLRRGTNRLCYSDQSSADHRITVTHEWRECGTITPPAPPVSPEFPQPGSTIRDSIVAFRWKPVTGCGTYHMQASLRPDFRVPYRPSYDVIINTTDWQVPYRGMFSPDTLYYWRVRSRSPQGIWSEWSEAWTFRWQGPCVPLNVRKETVDGGLLLRWEPNPRGTKPIAYDVYGSDEKGFSVHKTEYVSYTRGKVPANFLARTTDTSCLVVSTTPGHENMNKCFYRVVAVDEHTTESICSDFAEMPHPHVWTDPPKTAAAGVAFEYRPGVITSLGDVQHHYEKPGNQFWDIEKLSFSLRKGPAWLAIDADTGALSGTPPEPGVAAIELEAATQFEAKTSQSFELRVR